MRESRMVQQGTRIEWERVSNLRSTLCLVLAHWKGYFDRIVAINVREYRNYDLSQWDSRRFSFCQPKADMSSHLNCGIFGDSSWILVEIWKYHHMHLRGKWSAEDKVVRELPNLESLHTRVSVGTMEMPHTRTE